MFARTMHTTMRRAFVVLLISLMAATTASARVTFLPGAVTPTGEVDFARYDLTSPQQGYYRRNTTRVEVTSSSVGYLAAPVVVLDPIVATLVDHFGIPVFRGFQCQVILSLVDYPAPLGRLAPASIIPPRTVVAPIGHQIGTFYGITLIAPPVGKYRLRLRAAHSNMTRDDAVGSFEFAILPNNIPVRLEWLRPPLYYTNSYTPLARQPVLRLVDAVGNTVVDPRAIGNITVTVTNASSAVPGTVITNGIIATSQGVAIFNTLGVHVLPRYQGFIYNLTFTYTSTAPDRVLQTLVVNTTIRSSFCNTSSLQPAVYYYPNRTRAGGGDALVTIRGGPFLASMPQQLICRVNGQLSPAIFIDECNVNCSVPDIAIGGVASVSISIDGGTDFSDPMSVYFLGVDSALRLGFDDPTAESSNVIQLDPLGNTRVGNISVYVMDQHALDMWNFTLQDYSATLTSTALSLSGTVATNTLGGYGKFRNITFLGFPEVGDYVLSVSAVNVITQETLFGQRRVSLAYTRDICVPPPIATSISSIGCKTVGGPISLTLCGSGEIHPVTVHGKYFGLSGATAYVGSVKCNETLHDSVNVGSQLNCKCFFPTTNSTLTIVTSTAQIYVTPTPAFYMSSPVNVSQVIGCPTNIFPSTGACFTNTSTRVTVLGTNFGTANATVFLNHIITNIAIRCTNAVHSATSPTTSISCTIPVALGVGLVVSVRNYQTGQLGYPANYAAVSYVPSNGVLCQTDSEGYFCSQRGVCFLQNGTCNCVKAAASGFWTGEFCQTCVTGYYGAACTTACPFCSATSTCDDGVDGTGACVCQYGWGGALCDVACPGGSATPCSNHGVCISSTLACTCYNSDATGYWTGTTCSACSEGWSGSACMTVCPRASNRVCSGHGTCVDGTCKCSQNYCDSACNVSFAGCSGCVNGTYGKDCSLVCPGGIDNICFGNGYCGDGPFGNGLCTCNDGWGGANCTITCPHGPTNLCSGNGQCNVETGICTCNAGYTLADCGQECPGGASNPCNGQGTCNVATSTCACNDGWSSADCSVACPGGSSSPCNLHGQCIQSNSTCQCYADATRGHWAGATCSVCDSEWWGTGCRQQCPFAYNTQCGGHGQCSDAVVCTCYESSTTGFWSGSNCGNCAFGYYGSDCTLECPGTSCNPCYSRGNCSQGVNGTGLCTCDSTTDLGYWSGVVCDACSTDYYGDNCTSKCPTGLQNLTCSNRGSCDDGRFGSGTCTCYGTYGGTVCDVCATGYHGTGCATMCPGLVGQPCLLRGTCVNTEASNGTCTCNAGYGGSMCQYICPTGPYGICNGQGTCVLNSGGTAMICTNCSSSATTGYWTGDSCSSCVSGYYGSLCKNACPGGASSPCNNRGTCNMGYSGNGECTCTSGYAGLSCEKTCVGGALIPCSGHGTCDSVTGECNCYSSAQDGFWVDSACDSCDAAYLSSSCTVPCPTSITGTACSGHGTCYQGICLVCTSGFCGPTCSATTGCINCPLGTFGTSCQDCPGGRSTPCSNQGICLQGAFGSGACVCNQGYKGTNCSISCPGPAGVPCYGRGTCDATGACACNANWAGSDCNTPCNGFDQRLANSTSCSGVGMCSKVDGSCTCVYGYGGASCETTCPGTGSPCNGRGYCSPVDGTCQCYKNSSIGFWNGLSCGTACSGHGTCYQGICLVCTSGFCGPTCSATTGCINCPLGTFGTSCQDCPGGRSTPCSNQGICLQGAFGSGACVCNQGYKGTNCSISCPGPAGVPCYGRGTCDATGACACNANWAGSDCNTPCNGFDQRLANSTSCSGVGTCSKVDGSCTCVYGFGGASCETTCPGTGSPCNGRGYCSPVDGTCQCYKNSSIGFWNGLSCSYCQPGYYGANDCLRQCYQGVSDSTFTQCVCNEYWSGIGCETPCPGLLNGSNVCYGHGSCAWGRNFFGLCTCNATWYDPNCLTYCTKAGCDSLLINGQCNVDTGVCECEFDANGHWDYTDATKTSCDVCNVYYFGATCESPCACSRHGTCDRRTGACTCYADTTRGYWGGTSCAVCATGYIGVNCQNLNVAISPLGTVAAVATVPALDVIVGVICQDPLYPFIYIGTSPVMVLSSADVTLATLNLGGFAMECVYRSARELYIVTFSEARIRLNVINRQTGEYLRTEYVPLPSAVSSTPAPAVASFQRQLLQFEVINATILNGAVMGATSILLPFSGVSEDILIIPYGVGIVQFYQISSGVQVLLQTSFYEIVDAGTIEGIDNSFVIAAVVGNASLSHWEVALCDNSMPTSVNTTLVPLSTFYSRYGAYVASVCASCTPTKVFGDGDLIVMLFASAGVGMYLTRMSANATVPAYNDSMTTESMEPYFAMQYFYGSVCDVTATIIDGYASVGYFAMTCGSDPSVIMKFRLSTCYVTGIIALSRVGTDAVTVVRMSIDQSLRMLQVLTPLSRSQQMQKVSLYAVSELTPLLADTKGGTLITVTGEGFISGMTCVFNSVTTTPAIFIDQTSLICVAPPGGTVSCAGEPVEVNLAGAGSTNNAQLLQRVASASIREVINN
ncbi:membrane-associated protein, putative, partial [Bodo saltans]